MAIAAWLSVKLLYAGPG